MTVSLYASDKGAGHQAVVLLHGFGSWHGAWEGIVSRLPGRVVAYDLPGHGKSLGFPEAGPAKRAAQAILADLATRNVESAHIVGHSMGGAVATLMALAEPERVASLMLLAPGGFGEEINGPLLRRYAAAASAQEIRACLAAMSGPKGSTDENTVQAQVRMRAVPGQTDRLVDIAAMITRGDRQGVIPAGSLAGLGMPVRVVWGTADPVLPFAQTENLPARFGLDRAADAGHMLIEEEPDLVVRIVRHVAG